MNILTVSFVSEHDHESNTTFLRTIAKIDGRPLLDFAYFDLVADLAALQRSTEKDGEYFIVTCACGLPLCAGIRQGIQVAHQNNRTTWVYRTLRPDPITQADLLKQTPSRRPEWVVRGVELPTKTFIFDRDEYRSAVTTGIQRGGQLLKRLGLQKRQLLPTHTWELLAGHGQHR